MVFFPFCCYFIVQVQNVSSLLHNLICGLVYISEMVFPEYGVHFIAVNDGVDSIKGDSEFTAIRNVFNEMFAKDTSKKIKATWAIRSFQDQQAIVQEQEKGLE